jgi:hypothetical protein
LNEQNVAVVAAALSFSATEDDARFAPCVIKIAHAGLNRNQSVISKEVFEQNAQTAYGCPIVCNYDLAADEIGGHDKALVRTEDGAALINLTHPVGYVPEGARIWWESIVEDGAAREYLCVEAVLWKREAAFQHIEARGRVAQSMEISIRLNDFVQDGEVFIVNAFTFVAFCLLERDEPAMRSACVELLSSAGFVEQFSKMIEQYRQERIENLEEKPNGGVAVCKFCAEAQTKIAALETENQALSEYRRVQEAAERERAVQNLRAQFSDLADEAAFKALLGQDELSIEALTEKAYALRGRKVAQPKAEFSAGLPLDSNAGSGFPEHHPYGSAAKYFPQKN